MIDSTIGCFFAGLILGFVVGYLIAYNDTFDNDNEIDDYD